MATKGKIMQIVEIDAPSGEITSRNATPEEIAIHEADVKFYADLRIAQEAALEAKAKALESAKEKLAGLGLTPEELTSILG